MHYLFNRVLTLYSNVAVIHNKEHYFYKNKRGLGAEIFLVHHHYGHPAYRAFSSLLGNCSSKMIFLTNIRQTVNLSTWKWFKRRKASAAYVPDDASKGWSQGERGLTSKVARNIRCMIHIWSLKYLNIDTSTQKIACGPSWREGVAVLGGYFLHGSSREVPGWCCCSSGGGRGKRRARKRGEEMRGEEGGAESRRRPDGFGMCTPPRWATASTSFLPRWTRTPRNLHRWP